MLQDDDIDIDYYYSPPSQQWMITFADLLSLILTFFVLLYSMSSLETTEFQKITSTMSQGFNSKKKQDKVEPIAQQSIAKINLPQAIDLNYLYSVINDKFRTSGELSSIIEIKYVENRLIISLAEKDIFTSGTIIPTEKGIYILEQLGDVFQTIGNHIDIYGSSPANYEGTVEFPSRWELSLARSLVISETLRKRGYEYKIAAFGRTTVVYNNANAPAPEEKSEKSLQRIDIVIRSNAAKI